MITKERELIDEAWKYSNRAINWKEGKEHTEQLHKYLDQVLVLCERLLKERDAYREVANRWMYSFKDISRGRMQDNYLEDVDAETRRILDGK